jgi:hypothetical protein
MISDAEKVQIRRFCGYPAFGALPSQQFGYRFFQAFGFLEYRMNNFSSDEEAQIQIFLTTIAPLETGVASAAGNLDTDQAAVWYHNKNEVQDRIGLYNYYRRELCKFMGIPPGPGLPKSNSFLRFAL